MTQASQKPVIWTVIVATVVLLVAGIFATTALTNAIALNTKVLEGIPTTEGVVTGVLLGILPQIEQSDYVLTESEYEEDMWVKEAILLATEEWTEKDYKDLYEYMDDHPLSAGDIDEKEDIISVSIKEEGVCDDSKFDVDDEYAKVVQILKVRYENSDGNNVKDYVKITTIIEDGEIYSQTFKDVNSDKEITCDLI